MRYKLIFNKELEKAKANNSINNNMKQRKSNAIKNGLIKVAVTVNGKFGTYKSHRWKHPNNAVTEIQRTFDKFDVNVKTAKFEKNNGNMSMNINGVINEYKRLQPGITIQKYIMDNYTVIGGKTEEPKKKEPKKETPKNEVKKEAKEPKKEEVETSTPITPTVENMKDLLTQNKTYQWYGIRGVNEPLKTGEVLDTSYQWDWEYDRTTQGEENEEELGGVCTVDATIDDWVWHRDSDTVHEQAEFMADRAKWHKEQYTAYKHYYIVGSNNRNPLNYEENDEYEAILADAVVLAELNHSQDAEGAEDVQEFEEIGYSDTVILSDEDEGINPFKKVENNMFKNKKFILKTSKNTTKKAQECDIIDVERGKQFPNKFKPLFNNPILKSRNGLVKVAVQVNGKHGQYQSHRWKKPTEAMNILGQAFKKQGVDINNVTFKTKNGETHTQKEVLNNYIKTGTQDTIQNFVKKNYRLGKGGNKGSGDDGGNNKSPWSGKYKTYKEGTEDEVKYPVEAVRAAQDILKKMKPLEPEVTSMLEETAKEIGAKMVGLDFRLKSEESMARKIADGVNKEGLTLEESKDNIRDALRFTMQSNETNFTENFNKAGESIEAMGLTFTKVGNTWRDGEVYKGINCNFKDDNGNVVEIQFHTPKSFEIKEGKNHIIYEKQRVLNVDIPEEKKLYDEYREEMIKNSLEIPNPINIETIKL